MPRASSATSVADSGTNVGLLMAGIPSFPGPPDKMSWRSMVFFVVSVLRPKVGKNDRSAGSDGAALCCLL